MDKKYDIFADFLRKLLVWRLTMSYVGFTSPKKGQYNFFTRLGDTLLDINFNKSTVSLSPNLLKMDMELVKFLKGAFKACGLKLV